jgi:ribonuclease PH
MKKTPSSLRPLNFKLGYLPHAAGSCLVSMGNTRVLCVASIENSVPPHAEEKGTGWVTAEYAMLPHAGEKRSPRGKVASGGRVQEISRLVGRSLCAAVNLSDLVGYTVTVDCDVIQADGGTRTASINGGFVAMALALRGLYKKGSLARWPIKHFVSAVSVGLIKKKPVLDICYAEDKDADTDMNLVMADDGRFIELQGTAENDPFSSQQLNQMLALGRRGLVQIIAKQKSVVGKLPSR